MSFNSKDQFVVVDMTYWWLFLGLTELLLTLVKVLIIIFVYGVSKSNAINLLGNFVLGDKGYI